MKITNVMEYYNSSFLQAITNLMLEYKRLAEEKGIHLENPKPAANSSPVTKAAVAFEAIRRSAR